MEETCGYCGQATFEPLNRYMVHEYCMHDPDRPSALMSRDETMPPETFLWSGGRDDD